MIIRAHAGHRWARRLAQALPVLAATACLLTATPARALFEDDDARRAIIELRGKTELQTVDMLRRINEISTRLDALTERAERIEQLASGQLDLRNTIEALRQDIARLRGLTETQANELAQSQRRIREIYSDLDGRVKAFEPVQVQIDGATVTVDLDEKRLFEAALTQFRAGDFTNALGAFNQFRSRYPASPYTAGALFWAGNGQYALKDYKGAIATHQAMIARFPEHPRAADALLNVGFAQAEGGDKRAARKTLESVIEKYPGTPAAQLARERMPSIR